MINAVIPRSRSRGIVERYLQRYRVAGVQFIILKIPVGQRTTDNVAKRTDAYKR